jgi:protein TonB
MLLDGIRTDNASPLPDGDAPLRALFAFRPGAEGEAGAAPDVVPPLLADPADAPAIAVVPLPSPLVALPRGRILLPATAMISTVLHGALLAAFIAFTAPALPQTELPAVEVDLVEPGASPPPAAASPATPPETPVTEAPAAEPPDVRIDPPPMAEMPLPPDLVPPEPQVAEAPPPEPVVERQVSAVEPSQVTIDPPPEIDRAQPAELTPPARLQAEMPPVAVQPPAPRRETRRPEPPPQRRLPPPREAQRQETRPQPPRRQAASPPSAVSEGRGVTSSQTQRTATPPPSYLARVTAQLHRAKLPGDGQRGVVVVRFAITRAGGATGIALARSSGNGALDQAATALVRRASPFPPLPAEFGPALMPLTVPISFR